MTPDTQPVPAIEAPDDSDELQETTTSLDPNQIAFAQREQAIFMTLGQEALQRAGETLVSVATVTERAVAMRFSPPDAEPGPHGVVFSVSSYDQEALQALIDVVSEAADRLFGNSSEASV